MGTTELTSNLGYGAQEIKVKGTYVYSHKFLRSRYVFLNEAEMQEWMRRNPNWSFVDMVGLPPGKKSWKYPREILQENTAKTKKKRQSPVGQ